MHSTRGLTLIELVITVAIIGILAAIAYPSYQDYARRSNRAVAKTTLLEVQSRQDSYFSDRKRYATDLTDLTYPAATTFFLLNTGDTAADDASKTAIYSITIGNLQPAAEPTRYTLTATPINLQAADTKCGALTLRSTGRKTAQGTGGADCWR